jgi:hypothetical protein
MCGRLRAIDDSHISHDLVNNNYHLILVRVKAADIPSKVG